MLLFSKRGHNDANNFVVSHFLSLRSMAAVLGDWWVEVGQVLIPWDPEVEESPSNVQKRVHHDRRGIARLVELTFWGNIYCPAQDSRLKFRGNPTIELNWALGSRVSLLSGGNRQYHVSKFKLSISPKVTLERNVLWNCRTEGTAQDVLDKKWTVFKRKTSHVLECDMNNFSSMISYVLQWKINAEKPIMLRLLVWFEVVFQFWLRV